MCRKIGKTKQNEIKTLRVAGISCKEIAGKVNVSVGTSFKKSIVVRGINKGKLKFDV